MAADWMTGRPERKDIGRRPDAPQRPSNAADPLTARAPAVWAEARKAALTDAQCRSPLGRRLYDLRHAAVSLWLNSGVPATEVARRAGHGVAVLLKIYAHRIDGRADAANKRITDALTTPEADQDPSEEGDAGSEPAA
jgi:integrase